MDVSFYVNLIREDRDELVATEIWPSGYCNQHCVFCSSKTFGLNDKRILEVDVLKKLIQDLSLAGNKLVRFSGGGEPFTLKGMGSLTELVAYKGMCSLFITNGSLLNTKEIDALAKFSSVARVSFNGGNRKDYLAVHGTDHFDVVVDNMHRLSARRVFENRESELLLGTTFVVTPKNFKHISEAASTVRGCGFDFMLIRGLNPIRHRFTGSDYDILNEELQKSHALKGGNFFVSGSITKLDGSREKKKPHPRCYVSNFRLFVDSSGDTYPCFSAIMHRQKTFGSIYQNTPKGIWGNSDHVKSKKELNDGLLHRFCTNFCDHVEFNAFVSWVKEQLNQNAQSKFRRIPKTWAIKFFDSTHEEIF